MRHMVPTESAPSDSSYFDNDETSSSAAPPFLHRNLSHGNRESYAQSGPTISPSQYTEFNQFASRFFHDTDDDVEDVVGHAHHVHALTQQQQADRLSYMRSKMLRCQGFPAALPASFHAELDRLVRLEHDSKEKSRSEVVPMDDTSPTDQQLLMAEVLKELRIAVSHAHEALRKQEITTVVADLLKFSIAGWNEDLEQFSNSDGYQCPE